MAITVIYFDNTHGKVSPDKLDNLIKKRIISSFRRSDGWVRIGRDPVREKVGEYKGPERRLERRTGC